MYKKDHPDFMERLRECATLDSQTGVVTFKEMYAVTHLNMGWNNTVIATPYSHVVWFLTYGRWPLPGMHIDHINDNPFDNRPENLQEITEEENQKKRRGRMVYRSYGKGKYGYGINVHHDKRDGRYYVTRYLSRGHGKGDLRSIKKSFGGFDSIEEAKVEVDRIIAEIKVKGLDYLPGEVKEPMVKSTTLEQKFETRQIRNLRKKGLTYEQIARKVGKSLGYVYNRASDVERSK